MAYLRIYPRYSDDGPVVREVTAERAGDWITVRIDGQVVWRHFTRDRAFTSVLVQFASNRSPEYPKTLANLQRVTLRGRWPLPRKRELTRNALEVPIRVKGRRPVVGPELAGSPF